LSASENGISAKLEASRRELLDLGLRNSLLNYRPSRARGVEIVDELTPEVFRILVREGKAMRFNAAPEEEESKNGDREWLAQPEDEQKKPADDRHTDLQLQTALTSEKLQIRLRKTEYDARTFIEEQGTNILYLALGMLRWFESESSEEFRRAPLILVPVIIRRSSVRERFSVEYTGDDIGENLSLYTKLRLEFGISLPTMPNQEDLEPSKYLNEVEAASRNQSRWKVERNTITLGFFSFGKFLMYRDLDEDEWPEDNRPSEHPIIQALLGDGAPATEEIPDDEHLDRYLDPATVNQVVSADSSQALALLDTKSGKNLVIQGPPGTGKSQTITNVIAEAIGHGKKVLFVSEKMAALEVVKRRLDEVGLGDACLELHSHKTNKRTILAELGRTLQLGRPRVGRAEDYIKVLTDMRDRLNEYCEAMNTPIGESDSTTYEAIGELVRYGRAGYALPRLNCAAMSSWTGSEFRRKQEVVEELQAHLARMGIPEENPFHGTSRVALIPTEHHHIEANLLVASAKTQELQQAASELANTLSLDRPEDREDVLRTCRAARWAEEAPDLRSINLSATEWEVLPEEIRETLQTGSRVSEILSRHGEYLIPEAWEQDLLEVRENLAAYGHRWWRFASGSYRAARNRLKGLCHQDLPEDPEEQLALVDAVLEVQRHRKILHRNEALAAKLFGPRWSGELSSWEDLTPAAEWVIELHREVAAGNLPSDLISYLSTGPETRGLAQKAEAVESRLSEQETVAVGVVEDLGFAAQNERSPFLDQPLERQTSLLEAWHRQLDRLQQMVIYNQFGETCRKEGLEVVFRQTASWAEAGSRLVDAYRYTWFEGLVERAFRERPALARFDRAGHEYAIQKFRDLDSLILHHNRARLAYSHWQQVPNHEAGGQLGVLRREMEKKRRHLPIRQLLGRAGNVVQAIKPVFMMGPLSIANYLKPDGLRFDLVVFDEASQVRPVEAFGAIVRGRQAVVVGDNKQLPPTSFFDTLISQEDDKEENATSDLESILGLFVAQGAPERMLRWHYRSRHESLITVSNHEFYENRLVTFPSPARSREDIGLVYHHLPETVYDRGGKRSNAGEAKAVAQAVMEHARKRPGLTLGVAAFSTAQRQEIQDQLEILRRKDPSCEPFFADHPFEPFFVKNLENVQGDERDVIFISIGYGRDVHGHLTMSFGPLNQDGGERRLNVLITRARRSCQVFTNLTADDIDLNRSNSRGMRALKTFLSFARDGILDLPEATGRPPDSPFEEAVLNALQREGHEVHTQVGSAGFFIDLAVVDPKRPGRYLLGIECDGATYHSARSARDRDRLRQEVLENLGWRIHRIWSTDWFRDPDGELKRAADAIERARYHPKSPAEPDNLRQATDIERDEEPEAARTSDIPRYEVANFRASVAGGELRHADPDDLARFIAQIVEIESPIHMQELTRRILESTAVTRAGVRIRETIETATRKAARKKLVYRKGDFLWHPSMQEAPLRNRSKLPSASRKHDFIAPEEIATAIEQVVSDSFGMSQEEIPPAVLNLLLGFRRTSEAARHRILDILASLVTEGRLTQKDNQIVKEP
jgi:very-short-patch-repair endonuclease/DNA polymerase III delta prime subunit